jgi:hypothetical protein
MYSTDQFVARYSFNLLGSNEKYMDIETLIQLKEIRYG